MSRISSSIVIVVFALATTFLTPPPAAATEVALRPPTDASVLDPFRPPDGRYGAGNRGIEYATAPGATVMAAGAGVVIFAGPVGGGLHVTVDHGGGLLSTYSFVDHFVVRRGDVVVSGDPVARTGGPFHFGTRIDGEYVDPASLFGVRVVHLELIPIEDAEARARYVDLEERSERLALLDRWSGSSGGGPWPAVRSVAAAVAALPEAAWDRVDPAARLRELERSAEVLLALAREADPDRLLAEVTAALRHALHPPPCTEAGRTVGAPVERRIALVVDGLDSSSSDPSAFAQLAFGEHGYLESDVVRFSYSGGIVPPTAPSDWTAALISSPYESNATHGPIEGAIEELAATIEAIAAAAPGTTIDVYGHSLGGLVLRHALHRVDLSRVPVDVAITFASPHQGTPSAELVEALQRAGPGAAAGVVLDSVHPGHLLRAPVIEDLSRSGFAGDTAELPFPPGIHAVTVGARGDVVVPARTTRVGGARQVIVGGSMPIGAHDDLIGSPAAGREVALALAHLPPACEGVIDRLLDASWPLAVEYLEYAAAGTLAVADLAG